MDNPGALSLGDFSINTDGTQVGAAVTCLQGVASLALQARFAYGSGGTACKAYIQTSLDQGQTWVDIACFVFATSGGVLTAGIVAGGQTPSAPTDGALADNTIVQGLLGDQLRAKVVSVGGYTNSTLLSLWGVAR